MHGLIRDLMEINLLLLGCFQKIFITVSFCNDLNPTRYSRLNASRKT